MRIGLFGGTFDPIHTAHVAVADAAKEAFRLDRVLLIPAGNPPHKPEGKMASYTDRLRMVELACEGHAGLEASRLEEGQGKSYSIETIGRMRSTLGPGDQLFWVIGADAFAEIRTWRHWQDVLRAVEFIVISRPGYSYDVPPGAIVHAMTNLQLPVSSTLIRKEFASGEEPDDIPPCVRDYIERHGLYR